MRFIQSAAKFILKVSAFSVNKPSVPCLNLPNSDWSVVSPTDGDRHQWP